MAMVRSGELARHSSERWPRLAKLLDEAEKVVLAYLAFHVSTGAYGARIGKRASQPRGEAARRGARHFSQRQRRSSRMLAEQNGKWVVARPPLLSRVAREAH